MGLASCDKHDLKDAAPLYPIEFGQPHVESSTRGYNPSYSTVSLDEITVYGTVTTTDAVAQTTVTDNLFPGITVSKGSQGWSYDKQYEQYWFDEKKYEFVALAGAGQGAGVTTDAIGMPQSITCDVAQQQDLLLDIYKYGTHGDIFQSDGHKTTTVNFVMNHLLSKMKFTFRNGHPLNSGLEIVVKDIKIKNAPKSGTYTLTSEATQAPWGTWGPLSGEQELDFGNATFSPNKNSPDGDYITTSHGEGITSNHQVLMLPGEYQGIEVTFTAELYMNPVNIYGQQAQRGLLQTKQYSRTLPAFTLKQGKCYNIFTSIEMDMDLVTFQIHQTTGWDN